MSAPIDLRSDTVTRPTAAMRDAIAQAPVGDDQFGEDPTVNLLQERVAALLGKDAALWVPSGTMANQIALRLLTRPGDDVVVSRGSHVVWHETGAAGANSGVQLTEIGTGGMFSADEFLAARKPRGPHDLSADHGGQPREHAQSRRRRRLAADHRRRRLRRRARSRRVELSGRGAPVECVDCKRTIRSPSSLVHSTSSRWRCRKGWAGRAGRCWPASRDFIAGAVRYRRMFGGAMRQAGIFAAAGLYAIDHHLDRLRDDHENARCIADRLSQNPADRDRPGVGLHEYRDLRPGCRAPRRERRSSRGRERPASWSSPSARDSVRAVTHLDVSREECHRAADVLAEAAQ